MWRAAVVLMLSTLAVGQTQIKQWRYEFKGDKLGMSLDQFRKQHTISFGSSTTLPDCSDAGTSSESADMAKLGLIECDLATSIAGYPTSAASYRFLDGALYAIVVAFPHDGFDDAIAAVRTKYGAEAAKGTEHLQNLFGAHFSGRAAVWTRRADMIVLREYEQNKNTSTMMILDKGMLDSATARLPKQRPDF